MIPTLELNFALFSLFFTLSVLFFLLAGGVAATVWTRIGGWWGLVVAGIAFYIAAADIINEEHQMVRTFFRSFFISIFSILLLLF